MEHILNQILNELKEMKKEQSEIKSDIKEIKTEQQQIKQAVLETNESVKRLESIQESQQHIIDLLSARSIQHEAELKRIK